MIDVKSFLAALATSIASGASIQYSGTPRALWLFQLIEKDSTLAAPTPSPASVLRPYGGAAPYVPTPRISVQCMTTSLPGDDASGLAASQAIHGTLLDAAGQLKRNVALTGFKLLGVLNLTTPAQVSRDDKMRALWVFSFDCEFVPTA